MLVTFLLNFMFGVIGVQLFKVCIIQSPLLSVCHRGGRLALARPVLRSPLTSRLASDSLLYLSVSLVHCRVSTFAHFPFPSRRVLF